MEIDPTETLITGKWSLQGRNMIGDANCERIERLISSQFVHIAGSGWEILYLNPLDGAYWEKTYPQGEMHGGGPPELRRLSFDEAKKKYGDWSLPEKIK